MKLLRYLVLGLLALVLVTFALANRAAVPVQLLPTDLAALTGFAFSLQVPVWLVLFAGLLAGLILGFVWEWLRERGHRKAASSGRKAVARLEAELTVMRDSTSIPQDDVLALLEQPKAR